MALAYLLPLQVTQGCRLASLLFLATVGGGVLVVNGAQNIGAGFEKMLTGMPTVTFTEKVLIMSGVDPVTASETQSLINTISGGWAATSSTGLYNSSGSNKSPPTVINDANQVIANPSIIEGKPLAEVLSALKNTPGWKPGTLNYGRSKGKGFTLHELNGRGTDPTDKYIQYSPGSRRHFRGRPYWKVSSGDGGIQWFEAGQQ